MTATPIQSVQPSNGASTQAPERREPDEDATTRFRRTLAGRPSVSGYEPETNVESRRGMYPRGADARTSVESRAGMYRSPGADLQYGIESGSNIGPRFGSEAGSKVESRSGSEPKSNIDPKSGVELRREIEPRPGDETRPGVESRSGLDARSGLEAKPGLDARAVLGPKSNSDPNPGSGRSKLADDTDRRDPNTSTLADAVTIGSLHYSLPLAEVAAQPATTAAAADINRLIEQATSVMVERASRADASRFIVSLDHAIVGGASAEFVRDGAFLHVRLISRNDAAYRSMWAHKAELEERLAASTGLTTRVEIVEGYGDGRPA